MSPDKHIFYFKFFAIRSKHVQRINTVLLEEAIKTETLAYKSRTGLLRALEAYLRGDTLGFQAPWLTPVSSTATVSGLDLRDRRLIYVRMLR